MLKISRLFVYSFLAVVAGCADLQMGTGSGWAFQWPFNTGSAGKQHIGVRSPAAGHAAAGGYAEFNFDWLLSGDRQIMPLQVFDDGASMWLQFAPEGAWPAVFEVTRAGWRPLSHRSQEHYMVIDGVYDHLALRGGHLQGEIRKKPGAVAERGPLTDERAIPGTKEPVAHEAVPVPATTNPGAVPAVVPATMDSAAAPTRARVPGLSNTGVDAQAVLADGASPAPRAPKDAASRLLAGDFAPVASRPAISEQSAPGFLGAPVGRYSVSPADITMRQALERWARTAGWAFSAEHWDVDVDIPLVGEAGFDTDFRSAVRDLLAATEMSDRPLQPCFYSNHVLRVVPYAQPCDRRVSMGAAQ